MNKSISDFIMEQEQQQGFVVEETSIDTAFMEMSLAANLAEAYSDNAVIMEFCTENEIVITEGFKDVMGAIGSGIKNLPSKVWQFLKALCRNLMNLIAADKIDRTIATIRESSKEEYAVKFPDIYKLIDDIEEFKGFVEEGLEHENATRVAKGMADILEAANSKEALKKRYYAEIEKDGTHMITKEMYINLLRKIKDNKANVKVGKILKDLDKTNFKVESTDSHGNDKSKPSGDMIKSVKQVTKLFVKVYDDLAKAIVTSAQADVKKATKDMSKEQKDERQDYLTDERKRKSGEGYYV